MPQQTSSANCLSSLTQSKGQARGKVIGLVADSDLHRHILKHFLLDAGYQVLVTLHSKQLSDYLLDSAYHEPDAWLLDLVETDEQAMTTLLENSEAPLLANEGIPQHSDTTAYQNWQQRLLKKLELTAFKAQQNQVQAFEKVWVLAASLGGPAAVNTFLNHLQPGLPFAWVYAQHTEANSDHALASSVNRGSPYPLQLVTEDSLLSAGQISVVPVDRQVNFLEGGRILNGQNSWGGLYQPAIDQVISELAVLYRERLGVIVFTGLCNDGEAGCRVAQAKGATVWAQSPESCVSAEMPVAAMATGAVSRQGTPEQLAQAVNKMAAGGKG